MKKVLSFFMCVLILLSCMTLVVPAEESEEITRIAVTNGSTIEGWSNNSAAGSGIPDPAINTEIDAEGYGAVAVTVVGEAYANGGYKNPAGDGKTPTNGYKVAYQVAKDTNAGVESYDLTDMNYLAFDLYVSDAAALNAVEFYLELTSSGKPDVQERCWKKTLSQFKGSALEEGWNHFEIALTSHTSESNPGFNAAAWNFLRMYNASAFHAGEGITIAIKNIYFVAKSVEQSDEPAADPLTPVDGVLTLPLSGWVDYANEKLPAAVMRNDLDESGESAWAVEYSGTVFKNGGYGAPEGATGWKVSYKAPEPLDISSMNYLVFDFYVSDASRVDGVNFQIELNSHPTYNIDKEENNLKSSFTASCGGKIVNGWNHFELPLASFSAGMGTDGLPMDASRWTFMRLYTTDTIELDDSMLTVAYKNFGFAENGSGGTTGGDAGNDTTGGEDNAQLTEAAKEVIALYEAISDITVGKVNASNYEKVKAQLDAAIDAYNTADTAVQQAVDETLNVAKIERTVGRAIEQYENEKDEPADAPADPTTPTDPVAPTDPEQPVDEDKGKLNPVVIVAGVAGVVIVALVVALIVVMKKKK